MMHKVRGVARSGSQGGEVWVFDGEIAVCSRSWRWPQTSLTWEEAGEDDKAALFLRASSPSWDNEKELDP